MGRTKTQKFIDNKHDPRIVEEGKDFFTKSKGNWAKDFYNNNNPLVLELACGRGEYTVGLAPHFPDHNFLGVDRKGERMAVGTQNAREQ